MEALFSWIDYSIFGALLAVSVLIGIYFGFYGRKQETINEYLLGGKSMNVVPVGASLISSHISGIMLLGLPVEAYRFGVNYWWVCLIIPIVYLLSSYVFLPVFFKLQFTSIYEYLTVRFDKRVRIIASILFIIFMLLYNPIVIYTPALAFSQATGINIYLIASMVCLICIFYTTIGGLKTVIWTDALQFVGMIGSLIAIVCIGTSAVGGFDVVWETASEGQRLDMPNFSFDATEQNNVWAVIIGGICNWTTFVCFNQTSMQKFLAVPTIKKVRLVLLMYAIGVILIISLCIVTGVVIYAKYAECDPISTKKIQVVDQLLPLFVTDIAGDVPGLHGIFMAGIFSASLSTLSATLNTISAVVYEDFLSPFLPKEWPEKRISNVLKAIVVITGIICIAFMFIIENLGGIFTLNAALQGISCGPTLGLFLLGILFPFANTKGALYGGITGIIFSSWVIVGNQWYNGHGSNDKFLKPVSIDGCECYVNSTVNMNHAVMDEPFWLFRLSVWYNFFIGATVVVIVGVIVSLFTYKKGTEINRDLLSPVIHFLLPTSNK